MFLGNIWYVGTVGLESHAAFAILARFLSLELSGPPPLLRVTSPEVMDNCDGPER